MITVTLDRNGTQPLYEQLYCCVRARIESGVLAAGGKLPSKRRLALHLRVSRSTVENAYAQLLAEGYLYSVERKGYFVPEIEPFARKDAALPESGPPGLPALPVFAEGASRGSARFGVPAVPAIPGDPGAPGVGKHPVLCDLAISGVDKHHFPYSVWNKLQRKCIGADGANLLGLRDSMDNIALRREIAKHLASFKGVNVDCERVILGAGTEYLFSLLLDLLPQTGLPADTSEKAAAFRSDLLPQTGRRAGNRIAIEDPGNPALKQILDVRKLDYRACAVDEEGMSADAAARSGAHTLVVTPSCNFPTGVTMSVNRKRQLLRWLAEGNGRCIVEDDFDSEFRHALMPVPTLYSMDESANIVYMNSFTRTIAPSLRIAYMVLPQRLYETYLGKMRSYSSTVSEFEQRTLELFLSEGYFERHLMRMRKIYKRRQEVFADALAPLAGLGIETMAPKCGFAFILRSKRFSEEDMIQAAARQGVRLYPVSGYCFAAPPPPGTVLAGFAGLAEKDLREAGRRIQDAFGDLAI
jgi:GntR family transcriptional regulator/MocR family aminotransferase